ncbi:ABCF2-like protein [Mya arenaria]|uniref:ABCF2-like protein n=1 Tax=Mya arenaria TaxID=6604 RepID=A0ABY7DD41_MYAAR|nr:ABCF2-like protein [Mya arenaria]
MPSDAKKKRAQQKKESAKRGKKQQNGADEVENGTQVNGSAENGDAELNGITEKLDEMELAAKYRSCAGVLTSHSESRDVHLDQVTIRFHGAELLMDSKLELNNGRRYGLIGLNGCEMPPSDKTALECVMEVDQERIRLEKEAEILATKDDHESHDRLMDVYERLEDIDADHALQRAAFILSGLGFTRKMQQTQVKHFSGGWRMRISLARALFIKPALLLLDEPTNHLDLNACVWLEEELNKYKRCLVIVSHSQDFMNGMCTNIIHMQNQKLKIYGGNYDSYIQTRWELEENQMKKYRWEQDQISHMKNYIARFGHGSAKLARQAQSKEKTLKKMVDGGLAEKVTTDKNLSFYFPSCGTLPPPVIMVQHVSFRYNDDSPYLYKNLDFGVDLDTRVALVGPNGAGKSTLLKLIVGDLVPTDGLIRRHSHLKIGRYHQHLHEILDMESTALDWMMLKFPAIKEREEMRKIIGRYGLSGQQQVVPMRSLSDGQRCRVIFAWLSSQNPHLLLLDEPTNHLDIETIDSLAEAINDFEGGMILVSHDFRLISQVTEEIWICANETIEKYQGDIYKYKEKLVQIVKKENERLLKLKK